MSKEEKAKEYALKQLKYHIDRGDKELTYSTEACVNIAAKDYVAGYTQSEQDLSSQLTAYKEALSSLWSDIHFTDISKEQIMNRIGSLIQPKP